ncbi:MAG: D-glycerate dehydrogenase [Solirubrobacterales bacterium]
MARCIVTRKLPFDALERLRAAHDVEVWRGAMPPAPDELRELAAGAEGILSMLTDAIDRELIDACPDLRAVANLAVGTDNIDVEYARSRGIAVGNTPGVLTETSADLAFALLLAVARRIVESAESVRRGEWWTWEPAGWLGYDVHGATLGIVGPGKIGEAVARRGAGFGMRVLRTGREPGPGRVPLGELLAESDFVSLHCPLTPETRGLIDEGALMTMKQSAFLINTARGEVVDTEALRRALESGWIAGAGLDVTDPEPLPGYHPLLGAPNLTVVPHIGSASHATRGRMAAMAVDNLLAGLAGEPMPSPVG